MHGGQVEVMHLFIDFLLVLKLYKKKFECANSQYLQTILGFIASVML